MGEGGRRMKFLFFNNKKKNEHYDLLTKSGEELLKEKEIPWQEYPRPQMKRSHFQILNGEWKLNGSMIKVPFPPQSILSGYKKEMEDVLIYEKEFSVCEKQIEGKCLLHFGAVDQTAKVWVNDIFVGEHEGGYLPFSCDITKALRTGVNTLRVEAIDKLLKIYPYGKQKKKRGGMWYTPVSGIWQSVWLEYVPKVYIANIKLTPDLEGVDIEINVIGKQTNGFSVEVVLENGHRITEQFEGLKGRVNLQNVILPDGTKYEPLLWTTENPHLYTMIIRTGEDCVETYFALRTISIVNTDKGKRVCLNGNPVFLHGVLDQGYFSDGIYLPAKAVEYERDIIRMKELGINLLRKHIKVEPEIFYYACDRLGMLVMKAGDSLTVMKFLIW